MKLGVLLLLLGGALMMFSAYETVTFRTFVKESGNSHLTTPVDIILQCLGALVLCVTGLIYLSGDLKNIPAAPTFHSQMMDSLRYRPDFSMANHRGQALAALKTRG